MSNTNTEVLTTAYEKLQGAITQANTVLPELEEAVEKGNLDNYATTSQLEEKASNVDLQTQKVRIDNLVAVESSTDNAETADIRVDVDGVLWSSAGESIRNITKNLTEYLSPIHLEIEENTFCSNGDYNNKTSNTGYNTAIAEVSAGEVYNLKTRTFGGVNYAYSFYYYNSTDGTYTNKDNYLIGTAGTNIVRDVYFVIPAGVNRVIFSYQKGYAPNVLMKKREYILPKLIERSNSIIENLYEYKAVNVTGENLKLFENGLYPAQTTTGRYVSVELNVEKGEYYRYIGGTFGSVNYGYSFYNEDNGTYKFMGRFLQGTTGTFTAIDTFIEIPSGVNKLIYSCPLDHVQPLLLKRQAPQKVMSIKLNINDNIYSGMSANGGKLPLVNTINGYSMKDNCAAIIDVEEGVTYRLKGQTFGGVYFYTFYKNDTFVNFGKQGKASTRVTWDEIITIPNGVNKLVVNSVNAYGIELYKYSNLYDSIDNSLIKKVQGKNYACFGDSITSDEITGTGTIVGTLLGANIVGNFAHGNATASDWFNGDTNNTVITFNTATNADSNDNVLSNQVRRMLRHTTALGEQVKWKHPIDGEFSIDTSVGTGLGHTEDIPRILYIAISTNDGRNETGYTTSPTAVTDDTDTVFSQTYSQLTRKGLASSLRWAIETLRSAYPNAIIFVASPIQSNNSSSHLTYSAMKQKRDIIEKVCQFCSVHFIDSFSESGFSSMIASPNFGADSIGIHPNRMWAINNAKFIVNEIENRYTDRGVCFY